MLEINSNKIMILKLEKIKSGLTWHDMVISLIRNEELIKGVNKDQFYAHSPSVGNTHIQIKENIDDVCLVHLYDISENCDVYPLSDWDSKVPIDCTLLDDWEIYIATIA